MRPASWSASTVSLTDGTEIGPKLGDFDSVLGETAAFVVLALQLLEREPMTEIARQELGHSRTRR